MRDQTFSVSCLRGVEPHVVAGLEADLAFCHPAILGIEAINALRGTIELWIDPARAGDGVDLARQVDRVTELSVRSYRFVEPAEPLWRHAARERGGGVPALESFIRRFTRPLGPGQHALLGPAAQLRAALDGRLQALAGAVGAEPWHLPSIEQTSDLIPATGYFSSHGQHITFAYHLPTHFEDIRRFAEEARRTGQAPKDASELEPAGFILEPFVCHNVYRALEHERLDRGRTITALGTCYRHEGFRFSALLRQWEFSMREVVLAGDAAHVSGVRERLVEGTQRLVEELDLDATLEIATDPFFVSEAASARTFQLMQSTKLELRLGIDAGEATAAASFNLHGRHFTEPMDIRCAGAETPCETACIAFGLERWMAAFVARWGADPDRWPAPWTLAPRPSCSSPEPA